MHAIPSYASPPSNFVGLQNIPWFFSMKNQDQDQELLNSNLVYGTPSVEDDHSFSPQTITLKTKTSSTMS